MSSSEAWYLGHASPEELLSMVVAQEAEQAWEENPVIDPIVAEKEGYEAYRFFTYSTPQHLRDKPPAEVTTLGKAHGENPVSEKHTIHYLDDLIASAEAIIRKAGVELPLSEDVIGSNSN